MVRLPQGFCLLSDPEILGIAVVLVESCASKGGKIWDLRLKFWQAGFWWTTRLRNVGVEILLFRNFETFRENSKLRRDVIGNVSKCLGMVFRGWANSSLNHHTPLHHGSVDLMAEVFHLRIVKVKISIKFRSQTSLRLYTNFLTSDSP